MNRHSCKLCGKICLSNDFESGYCLACAEGVANEKAPARSHQRDRTIDTVEATRALRKENEKKQKLIRTLTEKQQSLADLQKERISIDESRAKLERSTKENLASILRLKVQAEELNTLTWSLKKLKQKRKREPEKSEHI